MRICQSLLISVEVQSGHEYSHEEVVVIHVVAESATSMCNNFEPDAAHNLRGTRLKHEVHDRHGQRNR